MRYILKPWTIIIILVLGWAIPVGAVENFLGLDDKNVYDIYIGDNSDSASVIRSVTIVGKREISNVIFLVIQTDSFDGKRSEGLVNFQQIRAILQAHKTVYYIQDNNQKIMDK